MYKIYKRTNSDQTMSKAVCFIIGDLDETWQVGLRPEKTKPCTCPAKSRYMWVSERARKKWVAEALLFCHVRDAPLLPLSLDRFSPNFPRGSGSRHMVSYTRKVSIKRSNFPKNRLFQGTLRYPVCAQPTNILARGRHHWIADLQWYLLIHCTFSS